MTRPRILLVDDRPENLQVYKEVLLDLDVELVMASSGHEALGLALDTRFALVVLDVQMPEMDGFETAELLRGRSVSREVPIIFVTAGAFDRGLGFRGYETGAVDFLFKPFDPHVLRSKVRVFAELERRTSQLREAKEAAESANRAKNTFLANMSHEMRTPLNAILGFTELALDLVPPESREYLDIVMRNGQLLTSLIDDLLEFSQIEAGKLTIAVRPTDLAETVHDVVTALSPQAKNKGICLASHFADTLPLRLETDPVRLRQILLNLVGNAVKYTPAGGTVLISVSQLPQQLRVLVRDTGIGIPAAHHDKIFDTFHQVDDRLSRSTGGVGLGLALARRLAQAIGADLRLEKSIPGEGSVFALDLPLHLQESQTTSGPVK